MENVVKVDENLYKETTRTARILFIILLCIGVVVSVFTVVSGFVNKEEKINVIVLFTSVFLTLVSAMTLYNLKKQIKTFVNNQTALNIEFFEEYMVVEELKNNEFVSSAKRYYNEFSTIKETKSYIICYMNKVQMMPIDKRSMSDEEIKQVKKYLKYNK